MGRLSVMERKQGPTQERSISIPDVGARCEDDCNKGYISPTKWVDAGCMDWCQEPTAPPCLTSVTVGRCRPPKRQPPSKAHRLQQIPEDKPLPLVEEEEPTEKKKKDEDEFVMNRSMSTSRSPRSLPKKDQENELFRPSSVRKVDISRPPSFLAELSRAQSRRNPDFLAELNKAQRNINPAPIAMKSPTFHA